MSRLLADLFVVSEEATATVCLRAHFQQVQVVRLCVVGIAKETSWSERLNIWRQQLFFSFFVDIFIDILILFSKATSAVRYMKSWRLECNSNSYGWNVGKRIISNRFLSNTVLFLTNMQRLNALFSS